MSASTPGSVHLFATLDTKAREAALVRDEMAACGVRVTVVDIGCLGIAEFAADVTREQVFAAAGASLSAVRQRGDRGEAMTIAAQGAAILAADHFAQGRLLGAIGIGGSAGTTVGTAAMRALPLGVPKVMVSTLASGQVRHYVVDKDVAMFNSVVDLAGVNRISRPILVNAARAMAGMILLGNRNLAAADDKPLVAATMFGVTTPCVTEARRVLEEAGYEVLVFHATGNGGQAMESLIADGAFAGVLDVTTTELADELVGGVLSAGPNRLTAAARHGVPQVVSVGAMDMVNFHSPQTVPSQFADRKFHRHNPSVTLMRTTPQENRLLGVEIAQKLQAAGDRAVIMLPRHGVSAIDREGQPFDDPAAREALFDAIRTGHGGIELVEFDCHINDPAFARAAAERLLKLMAVAADLQVCR